MQGPVRHLVSLLCMMLFVQGSLAVFNSMEELMAYYFPEIYAMPEDTESDVTSEPPELTTEWMTTFFSTTLEPTPHPLLDRCCNLGRYVAEEELSCQLIDDMDFLSKGRNRPGSNFRYRGRYAASAHYRHLYEECASSHARELRNEFNRCCKETALLDGEIIIDLPIGADSGNGGKKYDTRFLPGLRGKHN